jgi:predicted nucleic acid-binding protein
MTCHLVANVPRFTEDSAKRLVSAMTAAFPYAEVEPAVEHYHRLAGHRLPDENDRHVLAAAIAAEATVLCTANTKDFPESVMASMGVEVMTPDALLCLLIRQFEPQLLAAHAAVVASLREATDASTIHALRQAGAPAAAALMAGLLELGGA